VTLSQIKVNTNAVFKTGTHVRVKFAKNTSFFVKCCSEISSKKNENINARTIDTP
jgi:hypothetical protein